MHSLQRQLDIQFWEVWSENRLQLLLILWSTSNAENYPTQRDTIPPKGVHIW